jgi:hypothetical protein
MHRGDPRQCLIVGVQSRGDCGKPRHQSIYVQLRAVGVAEQMLQFARLPHDKAPVAPFDQRRAAEHQAVFGAGEAEIVIATCFTETPDWMNHFRPMNEDIMSLFL